MTTSPDFYVVMIDHGRKGREAIVDPNDNWTDALDKVREACADGLNVLHVTHVHDGVAEDRTEEACITISEELSDGGDPISFIQFEWIEKHVGPQAARAFRMDEVA